MAAGSETSGSMEDDVTSGDAAFSEVETLSSEGDEALGCRGANSANSSRTWGSAPLAGVLAYSTDVATTAVDMKRRCVMVG